MIKAIIFDMYETLITHYTTPLYFSNEMAHDLHMDPQIFQSYWRPTNELRTTGKLSFEKIIETIINEQHIDPALGQKVIQKRIETKKELFSHLHQEIIPLLETLKAKGIKLAIISNCFSEEATIIENSILAPYFDYITLSYRAGCMKPDLAIYQHCLQQLSVDANECLYIGDGGSNELEGAKKIGMLPLQACYYRYNRNVEFAPIYHPLEILKYIE